MPWRIALPVALGAAALAASGWAQDWPAYGGASGGGQHAKVDQLNPKTVKRLKQAWVFRTGEMGQGLKGVGKLTFEANPILAEGRLYISTSLGAVFALDPASGREVWRFDPRLDRQVKHSEYTSRGVSSWTDAKAPAGAPCRQRILYGDLDGLLRALDGATGKPCANFGQAGVVDLRDGLRMRDPGDYVITSPPAILGDTLVVGSAIGDNRATDLERGVVRAYDIRSGKLLWSWDPIPTQAAAAVAQGWKPEQAAATGGANAWPPMSVDEKRGLVFVPTGSPSPDFYGGARLGPNADANSLVALRIADGSVAWRRQLVHHDLWDYDLSHQPVLATLAGRDVVLQGAKHGFLFVIDRETGEFAVPVEERAVPASTAQGEAAWPTQPFPPEAFRLSRYQALTSDDAWGLTPFDKGACKAAFEKLENRGIFTPPSERGVIQYPGYAGGLNWGGVSVDPARALAIAAVMDIPMAVTLVPRGDLEGAIANRETDHPDSEFARMLGTPYGMRREPLLSPFGIPCGKPPWGRLVAIDLKTGKLAWSHGVGTTATKAPVALPFGMPLMGGPVTTSGGVVFLAATSDDRIRAFDSADGHKLWEAKLPAGGQATPAVFEIGGKPMLVIAAGGHGGLDTNRGDYLVAYRLGDRAPLPSWLPWSSGIALAILLILAWFRPKRS